MSTDVPAADRKRDRERRRPRPRPERGRPTDEELTQLVSGLARPVADLLATLSTSAVSVLRALLDEAYERGRLAGLAEAKGRVVLGTPTGQVDVVGDPRVTIRLSDPPPPGPSPALLAELAQGKRPGMAVPR